MTLFSHAFIKRCSRIKHGFRLVIVIVLFSAGQILNVQAQPLPSDPPISPAPSAPNNETTSGNIIAAPRAVESPQTAPNPNDDNESNNNQSIAEVDTENDVITLPQTDFFIGELGEAYVSFKELAVISDKILPGWEGFRLGMSLEEVNRLLNSEDYTWLTAKGQTPPFVTPIEDVYTLETYGNQFFTSIQFLFDREQTLYLIRVQPRAEEFSFLDLLSQLEEKYGRPDALNARTVLWSDTEARSVELNRSGTVRYLRGDVFSPSDPSRISSEANADILPSPSDLEASQAALRQKMLNGF